MDLRSGVEFLFGCKNNQSLAKTEVGANCRHSKHPCMKDRLSFVGLDLTSDVLCYASYRLSKHIW
jgi:hypothetical protein